VLTLPRGNGYPLITGEKTLCYDRLGLLNEAIIELVKKAGEEGWEPVDSLDPNSLYKAGKIIGRSGVGGLVFQHVWFEPKALRISCRRWVSANDRPQLSPSPTRIAPPPAAEIREDILAPEDPQLNQQIDEYLAGPSGGDWQRSWERLIEHGESVVLPLLRRTGVMIRSYGTNAPEPIVKRPIDYAIRLLSGLAVAAHEPLIHGLSDKSESVRALSGFMLALPMIESAGDIPHLVRVLYDDESPLAKLGATSALLTSPFLDAELRDTIIKMIGPWADQQFPGWDDGSGPTAKILARITLSLMMANLRSGG
jgi:hypothetical protein